MKRKGKLNRNQAEDTLEIPGATAAEPEQSSNRMSLVVSTALATLIVAAILGLQTQLVSTSQMVTESIEFSVDKLLAAVYGYK